MRTTIKDAIGLHAVTDYAYTTMGTRGRQSMDGTLKAVEYVDCASHMHLEAFIVNVAAYFAANILYLVHHLPLSA
ncbi:MAG TPA: hypothetical protein VK897_28165 [Anaerolineales bacterium]|nr:hypothetical protein [Anaerolineales bacterium]